MAARRNLRCILLVVVICLIAGIEGGRGRISLKRASRMGKGSGAKSSAPSNIKDTTSEPDHGNDDNDDDDESDDAAAFGMLKCQGQDMKMSETQANFLKECAASIGVKEKKEMTMEKFPCFAKCIFEHKKLVDEKGMPHKENIMSIMSDTMPDNVKQTLSKSLEKCLDEHASKVKPGEELCDSYADLGICVHAAYMLTCKP